MRNLSITAAALLALGTWMPAATRAQDSLPDDIHPVSLTRLPPLARADMDADGKAVWDQLVGDRQVGTTGPQPVSLYSPRVAVGWDTLVGYLLTESVVDRRFLEIGILVATWEIEQQYEYSAHEPFALQLGAPHATIDTIRYDREPSGLPREDTVIINLGRQLIREHKVDSGLFAEAVELFGRQGVVELVTAMGDYIMVGMVLTAIDQHLPENLQPRLPER